MEDVSSAGLIRYARASALEKSSFIVIAKQVGQQIYFSTKLIVLVIILLLNFLKSLVLGSVRKNISGQLAVVTGGGNGLGREICLELANKGCNIVILDVDENGSKETCLNAQKIGVIAKFYKVDVSDYDAVEKVRTEIENDIGPVDILVNNAGIMPKMSLREGKTEDIERILNVNVKSSFWTVRVFLEGMINRKRGHIVAISSVAGLEAVAGCVTYSTSKFALRGFMDSLREELRANNHHDYISTTTVFTTFINTRRDLVVFLKERLSETNMVRLYTPQNIAASIVNGIELNKVYIVRPVHIMLLVQLVTLFPVGFQDILRDMYKPKLCKIDLRS